jgi:transposase
MRPDKEHALKRLLEGASANVISKELGIHRSTILRWKDNDVEFAKALAKEAEDARSGIERLVPEALKVLEKGLQGKVAIGASRVALDIIKAAAQVGKTLEAENSGLAKRLAEIDLGNNGNIESDPD